MEKRKNRTGTSMNPEAEALKALVGQCAAVLEQGISLIEVLDEEIYTRRGENERSSIGTHFRHNLDFFKGFLSGIAMGRIDYHVRERNERVECDRGFAAAEFRKVLVDLRDLTADVLETEVEVRAEFGDAASPVWCASSALRELDFLQSHTVHHYALIAEKLGRFGFRIPEGFGVAPSTLAFWKASEMRAETAKK